MASTSDFADRSILSDHAHGYKYRQDYNILTEQV